MNSLITIAVLALMPALCNASELDRRPMDLDDTSEFLVNFSDHELLTTGRREWRVADSQSVKDCHLEIKSYYDKNLAQKLGKVLYTVDQHHYGSSMSYLNRESRDQTTLWLTTANKDLPLMVFGCFTASLDSSTMERKLTLQNIADLIQLPDFFFKPVFKDTSYKTAYELLPHATAALIRTSLTFSAVKSGNSYSLKEPNIQNGKLFYNSYPRPGCSVSYFNSGARADRAYEGTVDTGALLRITFLNENQDFFIIGAESPDRRFSLSINCFFRGSAIQNFSDIKAHLDGIIDIN
ncbi:MAG: hypothetical protein IPM97_01390 [Bdellovibrionaceae bacterium]|nr:hypothetical protein [Pseudobdellovibrionaceae bacterium]